MVTKKTAAKTKKKPQTEDLTRTRKARPYPASSFTDALPLGVAIMERAAGEKVRRLTLLQQMDKSPNSGPTKMMITNSGKYGITSGSYVAEFLELTDKGRIAVDSSATDHDRRRAAFELAIEGVAPFKLLYDQYKGKRLPEREVMKDVLRDSAIDVPDVDECVDTFTVNVKDLNLLRTIGDAETLVTIEQVIEEMMTSTENPTTPLERAQVSAKIPNIPKKSQENSSNSIDWQKICF